MNLFITVYRYTFFIGIIAAIGGFYEVKNNLNVNESLQTLNINQIGNNEKIRYLKITGGIPDLKHAYSNQVKLNGSPIGDKHIYIAIHSDEINSKPAYIYKSNFYKKYKDNVPGVLYSIDEIPKTIKFRMEMEYGSLDNIKIFDTTAEPNKSKRGWFFLILGLSWTLLPIAIIIYDNSNSKMIK